MGNWAKMKLNWGEKQKTKCFFPTSTIIDGARRCKKPLMESHKEDDVKDRLEDDDVAVASSFGKLFLFLHMLFLVVDILVILLRHPAGGE